MNKKSQNNMIVLWGSVSMVVYHIWYHMSLSGVSTQYQISGTPGNATKQLSCSIELLEAKIGWTMNSIGDNIKQEDWVSSTIPHFGEKILHPIDKVTSTVQNWYSVMKVTVSTFY